MLWGPASQSEDDRPLVHIALDDGRQAITRAYRFGGETDPMRRWISNRALDLVGRYLIGALDEEVG